jgi:hypothetical protein
MIAVYASRPSSPATTQHSLEGGALPPYPHRSFTGWTAPASPGALITLSVFRLAARRTDLTALNPLLEFAPVSKKPVGLNRSPWRPGYGR